MSSLMKLKGRLMAQASLLPGKPANNYMVAVEFEGERQVNVAPLSGCEDGCTAALKVAIEYLHSFGHLGIATDALVCGAGFWYRPPKEFTREMQGERPILVTNARDGLGRGLGRRMLEPVRVGNEMTSNRKQPKPGVLGPGKKRDDQADATVQSSAHPTERDQSVCEPEEGEMKTTTFSHGGAYSRIEYETMFAVRCVGIDATADIHTPKTVKNIEHIVNQFHTAGSSRQPYNHKQVVATLEELTTKGSLIRVGDCYKASPHVVCRNISGLIAGKPEARIMAIVELFGGSKTIHGIPLRLDLAWQFMIPPDLCDKYNEAVAAVLAEEFNELLAQSECDDESLRRAIKTYKEINVPYAPALRGSVGV